jgi:serine/threonine-protein kinase
MAEDIKWDQELKLRFYREARSAASLQHPNIVIIHDLGEEGKFTYIVMELLEGRDLKGIIRDREKMTLESKLLIMAQVSDGLSHAHQRGIIHRDVKPGNIHVTPAGSVKILDFGIARIPSSDLTRSGVRLGTPVYMSPEQIRGGHYDERSDMFSAGIVFYEFLTYTHPFRDKNIVKTMDNILFQTQLPFAEQIPDAPPGVVSVLSTCMA